MQLKGSETIQAPREKVWEHLTNPEFVAQCAPGLESLEIVQPDKKFKVVASVGLGNIKARFTGDVEWVELDPPNLAKVKGHGTAPGSAGDVVSQMALSDGPDGSTVLDWEAEVSITGTIASLAARMMGSVTQKLSAQFFKCVKDKIEE